MAAELYRAAFQLQCTWRRTDWGLQVIERQWTFSTKRTRRTERLTRYYSTWALIHKDWQPCQETSTVHQDLDIYSTKQLFSGTDNALNAVTRIGWDSQWCDLVWGTRLWRGFCSIQDLYLLLVLEKESRDAYLSLFHFPSLFPSLCVDCHLNMTHVKYIYVKLWQAV